MLGGILAKRAPDHGPKKAPMTLNAMRGPTTYESIRIMTGDNIDIEQQKRTQGGCGAGPVRASEHIWGQSPKSQYLEEAVERW